ncbi:MAG: dihydroorotate dehydrogenase [Lachnospiraceae bacterium]|jgi:dihydroorotate dehydrogenase (NAD+) catalytic subunit|nr:dihydroorotate dehydrogenase [Lachnospiraceae bacterium]
MNKQPRQYTRFAGVGFKNPVVLASGTCGFGRELAEYFDIRRVGGLSSKGLIEHPVAGNDGIRIWETASGIMNSVGLENPGVRAFIDHECEWINSLGVVNIVNLGGHSEEDYIKGLYMLEAGQTQEPAAPKGPALGAVSPTGRPTGDGAPSVNLSSEQATATTDAAVSATIGDPTGNPSPGQATAVGPRFDILELNISCPNVKSGGMNFGVKTEVARPLVRACRAACHHPMVVKLSPNAEDIVGLARMCEEEGADGVSLTNTYLAMAIDIKSRKPVFNNVYAGLSGPAIKPISLRMTHQVCKAVGIPVMGLGGITTWQDAIEYIMAGATCVQVGTATFMKPDMCLDIIDGIERYMEENKIGSLDEIRGCV